MIKPLHKWMLLLAATLAGAIFFLWPGALSRGGPEKFDPAMFDSAAAQEPITPIPAGLKLDANKVALGRRLFFDRRLSRDGSISCAQCHNLEKGGVDGAPRPTGIGGRHGTINTLTVFNSGFNFRLFWDARAATLEDMLDDHIKSPEEMDTTLPAVAVKLLQDDSFRRDFAVIYHGTIEPPYIRDALATFVRSLTTPDAKFDLYLRGNTAALDADELAGYNLFKNLGCTSCHQGLNVGGNMYGRLGLVGDYFKLPATAKKTARNHDEFRVPSLRNVALTAPYFHDASAQTLDQAVAAMATYQLGITLPSADIEKIVKFLRTLTGNYAGATGPKEPVAP